MNALWHDPVVAEIHAVRERLAEHYQGDLAAFSAAAEAHCRALGLVMADEERQVNASAPLNSAVSSNVKPGLSSP